MFEAHYSYKDIGSVSSQLTSFQDPYVVKANTLSQLRKLICELAPKLKLDLKVQCTHKEKTNTQLYVLIDQQGKEKIRFEHITRGPLVNYNNTVKYPRSIGYVNKTIEKVTNFTKEEKEEQLFKELLHKLVYSNEEQFLLDAYEQDEEFALLMQSKQGHQSLKVYIEQ